MGHMTNRQPVSAGSKPRSAAVSRRAAVCYRLERSETHDTSGAACKEMIKCPQVAQRTARYWSSLGFC